MCSGAGPPRNRLTPVAAAVTTARMNLPTSGSAAPSISDLSFEAALEQLGGIVRQLEAGQVPLDDAIALYERATALRAHCDARLKAAEARIERIRLGADGSPAGIAPFDGEGS